MNGKRKVSVDISMITVVLVACVGMLLIESQTKVIKRWIDDVIYDNRHHYLPCDQLPPISEVEGTIREH